jgi:hypothetical protein
MGRDRPGLVTSEMVTMDSTVDKARGELAEERTGDGGGRSETRGTLYGQGVPTAESYVDDMPLEWSRDETGAGPEMPGEAANPPGLPDDPPRTFLTIRRRFPTIRRTWPRHRRRYTAECSHAAASVPGR